MRHNIKRTVVVTIFFLFFNLFFFNSFLFEYSEKIGYIIIHIISFFIENIFNIKNTNDIEKLFSTLFVPAILFIYEIKIISYVYKTRYQKIRSILRKEIKEEEIELERLKELIESEEEKLYLYLKKIKNKKNKMKKSINNAKEKENEIKRQLDKKKKIKEKIKNKRATLIFGKNQSKDPQKINNEGTHIN